MISNGKRIRVAEARKLQQAGKWITNPNPNSYARLPRIFVADYVIHYRPDGVLAHKDPDSDLAILQSA